MAKKTETPDPETTSTEPAAPKAKTVIKNGKPRRSHRAADLEAVPDAPVVAREADPPSEGSEAIPAEPDFDAAGEAHFGKEGWAEQERQRGDVPDLGPTMEDEAAEHAAPESGPVGEPSPADVAAHPAKYAWLKRVNAQRALDHAVAQVSKHDFTQWPELDVHGVAGALAVLKNCSEKMAKLNKKTKPSARASFEPGDVITVKKAHEQHYAGTVDPGEKLTVVKGGNKHFVRVTLSDGGTATLTSKHFEAAK